MRIIAIAGPPGSGKSTLARAEVVARGPRAVVVPMDGFHFSNAVFAQKGLADRKGAPDTFDVPALASLLAALRNPGRPDLVAPDYSRELHDPVPNVIPIPADVSTVIVEGNYLGLDWPQWDALRPLIDELWFLDVPWAVTRERLIARRIATGRDEHEAHQWVDSVDHANDRIVREHTVSVDRVISSASD